MSEVISANYETIISTADTLRTKAGELNTDVTKLFDAVNTLHDKWHGKYYRDFATSFQKLDESFNAVLKVFYEQIPYNIQTIGENYKAADTHTAAAKAPENIAKTVATTVNTSDAEGDFYIQKSYVEDLAKTTKTVLTSAIDGINTMNSAVEGLKWEGDAATANKAVIKKHAGTVTSGFQDIINSVDKTVSDAIAAFDAAEAANQGLKI